METLREYDSDTLKKLQNLELMILDDFINICARNNLTYFALAGTQIGVIRHGGFIPWDDDIDVGMPRKDYERLADIVSREMGDKYFILNAEQCSNYPLCTTMMVLKGTEFVPAPLKDLNVPFGIYLDIYPYDNAHDNKWLMRFQAIGSWFWGKLLILNNIPYPYVAFTGFKKKFTHFITSHIYYTMNFFHVSSKALYQKAYKASCKYNHLETNQLCYFFDTNCFSGMIDKKDLYPLEKKRFDRLFINCPHNMDTMLKKMYGDYMQLPPEEKRKNHFPVRFSFGKWE